MNNQEKYEECTSFIKGQMNNAGFSDVVIGLSGGIDSALVAVMCVDALGAKHVHGVLLPGPYSSNHSIEDARSLSENLGITYEIISIIEPYEAFEQTLSRGGKVALEGLAAENVQARCRMISIMALSNRNNWLMVNTGNKSESMMGYSTLYGDSAGAFAPLGGLYKTDVFALSRWRNEQSEKRGETPPIPDSTLQKPPSAELAPNQEDERALGMKYDELDTLLIALFEEGKSPKEVAELGYQKEDVDHILTTTEKTAFKRQLDPPFPQAPFYA